MAMLQKFIIKAISQNVISLLPRPIGDSAYYFAQRRLGALRRPDPMQHVRGAVDLVGLAARVRPMAGARVFEVGTGRRLTLPITLWLCGAEEIFTVDLHRYLRSDLVEYDIAEMLRRERETLSLLEPADSAELRRRWRALRAAGANAGRISELCRISYVAPADAGAPLISGRPFDLHVSMNVLEHVPVKSIRRILREGYLNMVAPGALVHRVDLSDHFAQTDPRISLVNFLRYSEGAWRLLAGNRLMYQNRLRLDEWERLLAEELPARSVRMEPDAIDPRAHAALVGGMQLSPRFANKPAEINAVPGMYFVAAKR